MLYFLCSKYGQGVPLGLVEFKKCAILIPAVGQGSAPLGLVEFKKCAIFCSKYGRGVAPLGLVEFKKCAYLT